MAEEWLNHFSRVFGNDHIRSYSGGILTQPIHPYVIEVMKEKKLDLSHHRSKSLFTIPLDQLTHLISVCEKAREVCPPTLLRASISHWDIPDPTQHQGSHKEQYDIFRAVRDQIGEHVQSLATTLV